ncbi:MAG: putative cysteine ligase BshC [bacterium]|nr:MAG: putative cysteine ligase BshC [bacterium]
MFSQNVKIPYSHIPSFYPQDSIFLNYLESFEQLKGFYELDYHDLNKLSESLGDYSLPANEREGLYQAIAPYNLKFNSSQRVKANLEALLEDNCYTVCTGQQCGTLTGPLYTLYKAMTAILLADLLNQKGTARFVPVFWAASEDHDFAEVNHVNFLNQYGDVEHLFLDIEGNGRSILDIDLGNGLSQLFNDLKAKWPKTDFTDQVFSLLQGGEGKLSDSFVHLMSSLFKDYVLVIVEPYLLRELSIPINQIAFEKDIDIHKELQQTTDNLSKIGYTPALYWDEGMNLFYYHNQARVKLYKENGDRFTSKNKDFSISVDELRDQIVRSPELFSHNVILRPIIQDTLFPNAVTVGGPGEISYFGQLKGVYKLFQRKMPMIYPRVSLTLFEKKFQKIQKRFHFSIEEIIDHDLEAKSQAMVDDFEKDQFVTDFADTMKKELERLTEEAEKKGKAVIDSLKPSIRKIDFEVDKIKDKYLKKVEETLGISKNQVERLKNGITPQLKPQERIFNYFYFMNFHGPSLLPEIMKQVDITDFTHQVLFYE